jgi:hypothetical protein
MRNIASLLALERRLLNGSVALVVCVPVGLLAAMRSMLSAVPTFVIVVLSSERNVPLPLRPPLGLTGEAGELVFDIDSDADAEVESVFVLRIV